MSQSPLSRGPDWLARLQTALPVLVAAGLAGFSWWLVSSSPTPRQAAPAAQADDRPDYILSRARIARFDGNGRLEAVLDGDTMRHRPVSKAMEVDAMVLSARHADGRSMHATARQGEWVEPTGVVTLSGGADVRLMPAPTPGVGSAGAAVAGDAGTGLRSGTTRVVGEGLRLDTHAHVLSSTLPVTMTRDHSEVRAQTLQHDDVAGLTLLGGRVHGRLEGQPR
ncbi:LPS export ABC transporter periplasmic protein LptC [Aquabacterium sp.]|uniref:LPS export ABC transporter periplasmic protein LptC n=1 Tax=Aquabacterium sp. TaxID=1872578 RepID=UPI001DAB2B1D|nr:LPS export ABC transporter periplasmic protein LptC [Aquabacterium sp.]MBT9611210.1 LPS export ABC transporter periplasmic protein LptC [Aquabacterium sp.]